MVPESSQTPDVPTSELRFTEVYRHENLKKVGGWDSKQWRDDHNYTGWRTKSTQYKWNMCRRPTLRFSPRSVGVSCLRSCRTSRWVHGNTSRDWVSLNPEGLRFRGRPEVLPRRSDWRISLLGTPASGGRTTLITSGLHSPRESSGGERRTPGLDSWRTRYCGLGKKIHPR